MSDSESEDKMLIVSLNCHTRSEVEAAQCVEVLSRMMTGLALQGLSTHLGVNAYEEEDYEEEYENENEQE